MFKNLKNLLITDCEVIQMSNEIYIYPIFKNGRSSCFVYARENSLNILKNIEISHLKKITIFLRSPKERFVSGVHTFFYLKQKKISNNILKKIENFEITDKHFIPQYLWLLHLKKYYNGLVELKSVSELYDWIPYRSGPWADNIIPWSPLTQQDKDKILSINYKDYINTDETILKKYLNQTIELNTLIKEFWN